MKRAINYGNAAAALLAVADASIATVSLHLLQLLDPQLGYSAPIVAIWVGTLCLLTFGTAGIYHSWRVASLYYELFQIFRGCVWFYLALAASHHFLPEQLDLSERALIAWMLLFPVLLGLERVALRWSLRYARTRGFNIRRAVVIGTGVTADHIAALVQMHPWAGTELVGVFSDNGPPPPEGCPKLGRVDEAARYVREHGIDLVYMRFPTGRDEAVDNLLAELGDSTAAISFVPDVFMLDIILGASITYFADMPLVTLRQPPLAGANILIKRACDIGVSATALVLASPLMLLAAAAIKATSPGPVFFRQWRYGLSGKPFQILKFRTMHVCEDGYEFNRATRADPRITRVGILLRKLSIDELPQLLNVLRGDMSVVGPRPHAVAMNEEYRKLIPGYMLRHMVKPGITGLAQVNGCRGEIDSPKRMLQRIEYDLEYVRNWSLLLDAWVIAKTFFRACWYTREP